jgi:hypothetical protein
VASATSPCSPPGTFEAHHLLAYAGQELVGVCPAYLVRSCPRLDYLAELGELPLDGPVQVQRLNPDSVGFHTIPVLPIGFGAAREILARMTGPAAPAAWRSDIDVDHRVTGVRCEVADGDAEAGIEADLVVDASGRHARSLPWVGAAGFPSPPVDVVEVDTRYVTTPYRRRAAAGRDWKAAAVLGDPATRRLAMAVPVEDDGWLILLGGLNGEARPRSRRPIGWHGRGRSRRRSSPT